MPDSLASLKKNSVISEKKASPESTKPPRRAKKIEMFEICAIILL